MKIISRGTNAKVEPAIRCTCPKCSTLFEFAPNEAQLVSDSREGDYYLVECPGCKAAVTKALK